MNHNVIGMNILNMRKMKGLSQKELAEQLNYSDKVISKWERGESLPDIIALESISKYFGITIDELVITDRSNDTTKKGDLQTDITLHHSKKPSKILRWSIVPITILWLATIFAGMTMFLLTSFIYSLLLIGYGLLISYNEWETNFGGHDIKIVNKPTKALLMIDGGLIDKDGALFHTGIKLHGKVDDKTINVYISSLFTVKCEVVII